MVKLEPFDDFVRDLRKRTYDMQLKLVPEAVAGPAEFEKMRSHLLSLYEGIKVTHSFFLSDGQIIDCIPTEQQPSLRRSGSGPAAPPVLPAAQGSARGTSPPAQQVEPQLCAGRRDELGNEQCCPNGTIPMRRITLDEMSRFEKLTDFFQKGQRGKGHPSLLREDDAGVYRYAHAYQVVNNYGGSSWLNLWRPNPAPGYHSLSQHWYSGGKGSNLQTVECGWQVAPAHYHTDDAVLFIFWTADGYQTTGAYNLEKPGFVQVISTTVLGVGWARYSVRDGDQYEIRLQWYRDPANGNWWLYQEANGVTTAIGYYPRSLYGAGQMANFATQIDYGGEVNSNTGQTGQMGSGAFAAEGFRRAAYQRAIWYFPISGDPLNADLTPKDTPTCYTTDLHNDGAADWATHLFFGGPRCG
jgi:hypothetical protein